jgi:PAB1-binding protein PBP1
MATSTARQTKAPRKGAPEPARRPPAAWSAGARASQTFTPSTTSPRPANGSPAGGPGNFPPLGQTNGTRQTENPQDRVLQSLTGLTGTTVTISTKTAQRYEGVVASTTTEGESIGVTLKDVREISNPGAPTKDSLFISSANIDTWASGPADAKAPNGDSFRTDTDISAKGGARRERELQAWQPSGADVASGGPAHGDDLTFGPGSNNTSWDQFTANEKLFGVKTGFDEDVYTTRLDRTAPDFKERERKAQRIANEIIGATTNNAHIAEERNMNLVDDSGMNEEEKYGAVVRGTNAYVPPGARKPGTSNGAPSAPALAKTEVPKVAINGPDGAAIKPPPQSPPPTVTKAASPAPNVNKPPADPLPAFRDFVTNERQRLTQKRQALVKSEMDKRMAELVKFSKSFKLNKPIPDDLVPILAKDEEKQKAIREKASKDAASTQARTIGGGSSTAAATPAVAPARMPAQAEPTKPAERKPSAPPSSAPKPPQLTAPSASGVQKTAANKTMPSESAKAPATKPSLMVIQAIPPFKGPKQRQTLPNQSSSNGSTNGSAAAITPSNSNAPPMSPTTAANNRLNVNASSFRPNPKANAFSPVTTSPAASTVASASVSPKPRSETIAATPNPFFGTRPIKKSPPVNIKDDFNPFKHNKVVDAKEVSAMWPYSGKRYMQMFPPPQHQPPQHSPHMAPPGPPPMPPPSYEEDSAAQAAQRGYVYAYPPYGYPGQHMIPGMAPPGPPGAYMPGPFMQHMPYPPGMPPPNGRRSFLAVAQRITDFIAHSHVCPRNGSDAT